MAVNIQPKLSDKHRLGSFSDLSTSNVDSEILVGGQNVGGGQNL